MCRKLTLDFSTDAKHKQVFIWPKASICLTSRYRGIVRTRYQVLPRFSLGNDKRGADHVQSLNLVPIALLLFDARYIHPSLKPQEFSSFY
jgi:hypothetical protein